MLPPIEVRFQLGSGQSLLRLFGTVPRTVLKEDDSTNFVLMFVSVSTHQGLFFFFRQRLGSRMVRSMCLFVVNCSLCALTSFWLHMSVKAIHGVVFWSRDRKCCSCCQFVGCAVLPTIRQHDVEFSVSTCINY